MSYGTVDSISAAIAWQQKAMKNTEHTKPKLEKQNLLLGCPLLGL
jgi:hypothetical protein